MQKIKKTEPAQKEEEGTEEKMPVKFIGFDMDFTLLKYGPIPAFHRLCFESFSKSICEECG